MEQKLQQERYLRNVDNPAARLRDRAIQRIQVSYGYDYENAEKVYEMMRVKQVEQAFGLGCGGLAAYKFMPLQREMEASQAIFRKAWMRVPMLAGVFGTAYYLALQLPVRFFQKATHRNQAITNETYYGRHDLVGRFRIFENEKGADSAEDQLLDHLAMYDKDPLSKPELVNQLMKRISEQTDLTEVFRIKRLGKDSNDFFWKFGKIHGLENIAFCDPAELAKCGNNPYAIQQLINKVTPEDIPGVGSNQELRDSITEALGDYKAKIDSLNLYPSDRKKLLALPFYLAKRSETPTPKRGQASFELFEELAGEGWFDDANVDVDSEEKITEFDYEKYLNPELLKRCDTESDSFKTLIRQLNYVTKTKNEALQEKKKEFGNLQEVMAGLNAKEQRAFIHLLKNKASDRHLDVLLDPQPLRELAKVSEEANHAIKNRYIHDKKTMQYANKKRMATDERTVRDMLRNQHIFRNRIVNEIPNYQRMRENDQFEHGLLTYLREGAYGELGDLVKEVGIKRDTIPFYNLTQYRQFKDNLIHDSDHQFTYLMSALFTPVDMTDHETDFVGFNELPGSLPLERPNWLSAIVPEPHPQVDAFAAIEEIENPPRYATN